MKGINFITDDNGRRTAVVIDIATYGDELQDFLDGLEAESRRGEPTEEFGTVMEQLRAEKQNG